MAHPIAPSSKRTRRRLLSAAAIILVLVAYPLIASLAPVLGAAPAPPTPQKAETDSNGGRDLQELKERLRALGEALRNAIEDATQSLGHGEDDLARGRGGLGALAPKMEGRDLRTVYGPKGPTVHSVRALLNYRLVLLGNDRLTAGRVYERDTRIIAEVVTAREKALVARYMINKTTGVWVPER